MTDALNSNATAVAWPEVLVDPQLAYMLWLCYLSHIANVFYALLVAKAVASKGISSGNFRSKTRETNKTYTYGISCQVELLEFVKCKRAQSAGPSA
jgi:hypothetical protein